MMKILLTILLCIAILSTQAQGIERWKIEDVQRYLKDTTGPAVKVINVWATFCKPCVAEIPGFVKVINEYKEKASLLLLSVDLKSQYPIGIATFVSVHQFNAPVKWLDETDADYFCPKLFPTWEGSIPATLILNTHTGYKKFFEDEIDAVTFEKEVRAAL